MTFTADSGRTAWDEMQDRLRGNDLASTPWLPDPVQRVYAQRTLAKQNKPSGFMQAVGSVVGKRFVMGALSVLDAPRRFVTSTLQETADFIQGEGFDTGEWKNQFLHAEHRVDFGQWIDDITGGIPVLDNVLGFAGDVLLDPLTYVSFGTSQVVKLGSTGLARKAFESGLDDIGAHILRKGYTSLDDSAWKRLAAATGVDLRGGARVNLGRTRVGQAVAKSVTLGRRSELSLAIGGKTVSKAVGKVAFKPLAKFQQWRAAGLAKKMFNGKLASGDRQAARMLLNSADDLEVKRAFQFMEASNKGRFVVKRFGAQIAADWNALARNLHEKGYDGVTLTKALDGDPEAIARMGDDYVQLKAFADGLPGQANEVAGRVFLNHRDDWFPKVVTDEFAGVLRQGLPHGRSHAIPYTIRDFEKNPRIVRGARFMGEEILDPAEAGMGVYAQAHAIYLRKSKELGGPEVALKWYDEDLYTAMPVYLEAMAYRSGEQRVLAELERVGIAGKIWKDVSDVPLAQTELDDLNKANADLRDVRREVNDVEAALRQTEAEAAGLRTEAEVGRIRTEDAIRDADRAVDAGNAVERATRGGAVDLPKQRVWASQAWDSVNKANRVFAGRLSDLMSDTVKQMASTSLVHVRRLVGRPMQQWSHAMRQLERAEQVVEATAREANSVRRLPKGKSLPELGPAGTAMVRAEQEVIRLEDEIAALRTEYKEIVDGWDAAAGGRQAALAGIRDAVTLRKDMARRAGEYIELLDEKARLEARIRAKGSPDEGDIAELGRLAARRDELNADRGMKARHVAADDGVQGWLSRDMLEDAVKWANHEASLLSAFMNGFLDNLPPLSRQMDTHLVKNIRSLTDTASVAKRQQLGHLLRRRADLEDFYATVRENWAVLHNLDADAAGRYVTDWNMPFVGADGKLRLRGPDGSETNVWFPYAGHEPLTHASETVARQSGGVVDWIGPGAYHNPRESALVPYGTERLAPYAIHSKNPRVMAGDRITEPFKGTPGLDRALNTRGGYGSGQGAAMTALQNEMFLLSFRNGMRQGDEFLESAGSFTGRYDATLIDPAKVRRESQLAGVQAADAFAKENSRFIVAPPSRHADAARARGERVLGGGIPRNTPRVGQPVRLSGQMKHDVTFGDVVGQRVRTPLGDGEVVAVGPNTRNVINENEVGLSDEAILEILLQENPMIQTVDDLMRLTDHRLTEVESRIARAIHGDSTAIEGMDLDEFMIQFPDEVDAVRRRLEDLANDGNRARIRLDDGTYVDDMAWPGAESAKVLRSDGSEAKWLSEQEYAVQHGGVEAAAAMEAQANLGIPGVNVDRTVTANKGGLFGQHKVDGLTPARLAGAARQWAEGATAKGYGQTGRWKRLQERLAELGPDDIDETAAAFYEAFGDMFRGHLGRRFKDAVTREHWVMNRVIDDAFGPGGWASAKHKALAAETWVSDMRAKGFDSLLYTGRDGNWAVKAFDPEQLENARYMEPDNYGNWRVDGKGNVTKDELRALTIGEAGGALAKRVQNSKKYVRELTAKNWAPGLHHAVPDATTVARISDDVDFRIAELTDRLPVYKGSKGPVIDARSVELDDLESVRKKLDDAVEHRTIYNEALEAYRLGKMEQAAFEEAQWNLKMARLAETEALADFQRSQLVHAQPKLTKAERARDKAFSKYKKAVEKSDKAWESATRRMNTETGRREIAEMMQDAMGQYAKIDDDLQVPQWAAAALRDQHRFAGKADDFGLRKFFDVYDKVTQSFKAWSVASPGFHARNLFSGMFNNHLAGVDPGTYKTFWPVYRRYMNAVRGTKLTDGSRLRPSKRAAARLGGGGMSHEDALEFALSKGNLSPHDKQAFRMLFEDGHFSTTGQFGEIVSVARGQQASKNPFSARFAPLQSSRRVGESTEVFLRGALAFDRIRAGQKLLRNGQTSELPSTVMRQARANAVDDVIKFHFDYDDLSKFERNVARRVMPFYTWTRKNFPLQVEMALTKPGAYTRVLHLKRNAELGQDEFNMLPDFMQDQVNIRTPFGSPGEPIFLTPDLPFRELTRTFNPDDLISGFNPIPRAFVEASLNRKFFTGAEIDYGPRLLPPGLNGLVQNVPGMKETLQAVGLGIIDEKTGEFKIPAGWAYYLDQNVPLFNRLRTMVPNEQYHQEKAVEKWANFLTGLNINEVTFSEQRAAYRRNLREGR